MRNNTIIKELVLAVGIGALIGGIMWLFASSLIWANTLHQRAKWLIVALPLAGLFTAVMLKRFGKGSEKGNNLVLDGIRRESGFPVRLGLFAFGFPILSHLLGASVGKEGSAIQIGSSIAAKVNAMASGSLAMRRRLVLAAAGAVFGTVFNAPLAGLLFAMEFSSIGKRAYDTVPDSLAMMAGSYGVCTFIIHWQREGFASITPDLSVSFWLVLCLSALVFGLLARGFIRLIVWLKTAYFKAFKASWRVGFIGGLFVLAYIVIFNAGAYSGLSQWMITSSFAGQVSLMDVIHKFVLTLLSLAAGFLGGEATPLFEIGAASGSLLALWFHQHPAFFSAIGYILVFTSAANVPFTGIVMGVELFGLGSLPYVALAMFIAYFTVGHQRLYGSQILVKSKYHWFKSAMAWLSAH